MVQVFLNRRSLEGKQKKKPNPTNKPLPVYSSTELHEKKWLVLARKKEKKEAMLHVQGRSYVRTQLKHHSF